MKSVLIFIFTFFKVHQIIENRLKALNEQFFDKIPHEMATFGFRSTGLTSKIEDKVNKIPKTWSVSAFPPHCSAEFGIYLTVNKSQTFVAKLRDFQKKEAFKNKDLDEDLEKIDMNVIVKDSIGKYISYFMYFLNISRLLIKCIGTD